MELDMLKSGRHEHIFLSIL